MYNDGLESVQQRLAGEAFDAWVEWLGDIPWKIYATFTTKEIYSQDTVMSFVRSWNQKVNRFYLGNNYTRKVKHGFFSYVVGYEPQERGAFHCHMLVDENISYSVMRESWDWGYSWIEPIDDVGRLVSYVTKYALKGGLVDFYKKGNFSEDTKILLKYLPTKVIKAGTYEYYR
jgi:hypothetical protein